MALFLTKMVIITIIKS